MKKEIQNKHVHLALENLQLKTELYEKKEVHETFTKIIFIFSLLFAFFIGVFIGLIFK